MSILSQPTPEGPYRIRFYEQYGRSPVWQLVPQAMTYLEKRGFARLPYLPPDFTDPCVAAIGEDGKAIAFMTYNGCGETWFITLSSWFTSIDGNISTPLFSMPFATKPKSKEMSFQSHAVRTPTTWPPKQHSKRKVGQRNPSRIPIR